MDSVLWLVAIIPPLIVILLMARNVIILIASLSGAATLGMVLAYVSHPYLTWLSRGAIFFGVITFGTVYYLIRLALFSERIGRYITKGRLLLGEFQSDITSDEYENEVNKWSNKAAVDIRRNKGKSEENLFLIQGSQNQNESLDNVSPTMIDRMRKGRTHNMLNHRIDWLEELQQRL